ncbi:trehalase-like isoform X2 [Adelges cooleyi]|nr:trehalase-like isoform X2 [Adelges cooleyi]
MSSLYPKSRTFLLKKLKYTESEILKKYENLKQNNLYQVPSNTTLKQFINENFEDGNELEEWTPTDFTKNPSIITKIRDQNYKQWTHSLNQIWKTLSRKIKDDVKIHPDKYSLIWVPNGFVIPGGIFEELYYWDTYWIVKGLLLCDMKKTARGVIDNLVSMVHRYGFMPNGSRVYYLNRTQPPMLILMVLSYYRATNDFEYVKSILPELENEFKFWLDNRMITFFKDRKPYRMARYYAPSKGPRPETYRNDYIEAQTFRTEEEKNKFYINVKSAAESGWDFSSRWYITPNGTSFGHLSDIATSNIIPVDLNSILQTNAVTLSSWFYQTGDYSKADKYRAIAYVFLKSIQDVMWRADKGTWFDWDTINNKSREYFYASNFVPLWTGSFRMPRKTVSRAVLKYLKDHKIIESDYSVKFYGIPTSMYLSKKRWDYPNAWPPLQAFLIQGLDRTQRKLAQKVATSMAKIWLHSNYKGFAEKSMMFKKYDVLVEGENGDDGEISPQIGFGWTNGVVLEFLNRWGDVASYN